MPRSYEGFTDEAMHANINYLKENSYPGRGIVMGMSEDGEKAVQAYWVMGRSENSRNRVLVHDEDAGLVRTEAHDPSKVVDPTLIIYNAMQRLFVWSGDFHVVSNGNQTDDCSERFLKDRGCGLFLPPISFGTSLLSRDFEPDSPNYTPRITGFMLLALDHRYAYSYYGWSIIKRDPLTGNSIHTFSHGDPVENIPKGVGICWHTYEGDGDPLPAFEGNPYPVPVQNTAEETASNLWNVLNKDHRVAIAAKTIDRETGEVEMSIINQLG